MKSISLGTEKSIISLGIGLKILNVHDDRCQEYILSMMLHEDSKGQYPEYGSYAKSKSITFAESAG